MRVGGGLELRSSGVRGGYWGLGRLLEERFGFGFLIVNLCFLKALDEDDGSTGVIHLIFSEEFLKASGRIGTQKYCIRRWSREIALRKIAKRRFWDLAEGVWHYS